MCWRCRDAGLGPRASDAGVGSDVKADRCARRPEDRCRPGPGLRGWRPVQPHHRRSANRGAVQKRDIFERTRDEWRPWVTERVG